MLNHVLNSVFSPHLKILFLDAHGFHSTEIKVLKTMQSTEYSTVNSVITEAIFFASSSFKTRMVICMAHPFMSACETATRETINMVCTIVKITATCALFGAVDKPYPIFKLRDKIEEKTGWEGYADTDRR